MRLHFIDKPSDVDTWETRTFLAPLDERGEADWANAQRRGDSTSLSRQAPHGARYAEAPATLSRAQSYAAWGKQLVAHAFEHASLEVWRCAAADASSAPGSSEAEFRAHVAHALREKRDAAVEALRKKYAPRLTTLEDQISRAGDRIERERSQLSDSKMNTALSVGTSILGALLGRKKLSVSNVGRIGSAARGAGRIGRESNDVQRAEESLEVLKQRQIDLQNDFAQETSALQSKFEPASISIEKTALKPRKSDIDVKEVALAWVKGR